MNTNNFMTIGENSKSSLGMVTGTRRSYLRQKISDDKSRGTVPLTYTMLLEFLAAD